jgi:hypothetical protein
MPDACNKTTEHWLMKEPFDLVFFFHKTTLFLIRRVYPKNKFLIDIVCDPADRTNRLGIHQRCICINKNFDEVTGRAL